MTKRFMFSRFVTAMAVAATLATLTTGLQASSIVPGSRVKLQTDGLPGALGEIGVYINNAPGYVNPDFDTPAPGLEDFRTFCAEVNEPFGGNAVFHVSNVGTVTSSGFSLSNGAAWLFREFTELATAVTPYVGDIGGQSYDSTDGDANLLQAAIWWLIDGQTDGNAPPTTLTNKYIQAVEDNIGAVNALVDFGGVRILDLTTPKGLPIQDMLYLQESVTVVPEPMSAALWGTMLVGGALARRRRKRTC